MAGFASAKSVEIDPNRRWAKNPQRTLSGQIDVCYPFGGGAREPAGT
jgi:hypothetical protein